MYLLISFLPLLNLFVINADVITNFEDKKDIKLTMFDFENHIDTEKLQHWIHDGKVSANPVTFEPPYLDFPETPIGQPKWDHVKILNEDETISIHLYSISSNTIDFHCSLFREEIIPGGGNSSFDVVFLSRQMGLVKNTLYIHTSRGTFHYKVSGYGTPSPYRIKSFFKIKMPLNSTFTSPIYFHNPYVYPIQILEMYTSGGDAHLELPNQSKYASKKLWIVPSYETRTIMRVKYFGRKVGNFTSFIRIRTNTTDNPFGFVIPFQIEISNNSLLYSIYDNIYFGILRSLDSPKSMKLIVVNSANESIRIKSVFLQKTNDAINIDFQQINVLPGINRQTTIASITFSAFKAILPEQSSGQIIVKTFQNQILIVPYVADVIHGSLVYDANNTKFFSESKSEKSENRHIAITNTFDFTIAIYSISLPTKAGCCFKISNLTFPIYIKSQETDSSIKLQFFFKNIDTFITQIAIFSNISLFVIPLFVYNGKLTVVPHRPEIYNTHLDFGTLGTKSEEFLYFTLKNENPTEVTIFSMSTNWFLASVSLIGIEKGNNTVLQRNTTQKPTINYAPLILKPYHFGVFRLNVLTPDTKGVFASDISIVTQYEKLSIPYYLRTTDGIISSSSSLILKNCFPTRVSKMLMTLNSSFQSYVELTSVKFIPNDTRFIFDTRSGRNLPILIKPLETTAVGYIKFSFGSNCLDPLSDEFVSMERSIIYNDKKDITSTIIQFKVLSEINGKVSCYVGFSTCTKLGYQWLMATDMNTKVFEIDKFIYKRVHQQWEAVKAMDNHRFNITMQMDTSSIKGFLSNIQAQLIWPSILSVSSKIVKFPLTQIGNFSFRDILLENPSDKPILLQIILISHYYDPYSLIELLGISNEDVDINSFNVFTLHPKNIDEENYVYTETIKENSKIASIFSIIPHNESITTLLSPRSKEKVRVYFNPSHETLGKRLSTVLILRNNLTSIETVWLEGQGTYGELLFQSGHLQEETSILHFELTEKHLKSCDFQPKGVIPSFTVRRPFVIKNIGKIPVYIMGFQFGPFLNLNENSMYNEFHNNDSNAGSFPTILENVKPDVENKGENMWCAGYGFEILECYGYRLDVNETLKLEIVFTPDFSLHKVIQQLQIHTSLSEWPFNVTVQASLPAHMLHRCSQALARPDSEVLIWYMAIVVLSVVTIAVILMSYYEADRIFTSNVIYRHLSSVAIGSYPHSSTERICDFRNFSKNSPFISSTCQLSTSPRSSVHDYLSIFNRNECDSTVVKRINICKKHDDKIGMTEKIISQSFCGKNIPENLNNVESSCNPLTTAGNIHQHKKKRKRGIFFGLIQWLIRLVTQILNQNTALKPRLDDSFNYKTDAQKYIKTDNKIENSNKTVLNVNKSKVIYCNQDSTNSNNASQNTISSNNNNNQSTHSKKGKNRSYCATVNVPMKNNTNKSQESSIATLNFAPIDIPALETHKCKKNITNKKNKKTNQVTFEELKVKSNLRMDDSLSVSTDSSTEEKVREIENNKSTKLDTYKPNKSRELPKSCNIFLESFVGDINKQNVFVEFDENCSTKSTDSAIDGMKNKKNFKMFKNTPENISYRSFENVILKSADSNNQLMYRENLERKDKVNTKVMKNFKSQPLQSGFTLKDNKYRPRCISPLGEITSEKEDGESDELIQWDNESVINTTPEDFSILSERTNEFSNFLGINNSEEIFDENSNSNIEDWLSSANNLNHKQSEMINDDNSHHTHEFTCGYNDDRAYQIDKFYQMHDCNFSDQMLRSYYRPSLTQLNSDRSINKNHTSSLYSKNKFHQPDLFINEVPVHVPNNFISLELPGIAHGRKQSLLEYERRAQKDPIDCEWLTNNPNARQYRDNFLSLSNSYWNESSKLDTSMHEKASWNSSNEVPRRIIDIENPLWTVEKSWNQIEPGSQHDPLARTLLPVGLLSNESSSGVFSNIPDNLWKFKPDETNVSLPSPCKLDSIE